MPIPMPMSRAPFPAAVAHRCRSRSLAMLAGVGPARISRLTRSAYIGHAWAVPGPLNIRGSVVIPEAELTWRFSRSSGPGGQGVNTTDSRVELSYDVAASTALGPTHKARALERLGPRLVEGVLTVTASEHRSQLRNRQAAANRLASILTDATAPPPAQRRATRPSRAARERRLAEKRRRSEVKRLRRPGAE